MNAIVRGIMWVMFFVVVAAWSIIGFLLWVPLLLRATTVFSAMVVHATMTGQRPDALRRHLELACRFYPEGFRIAYEVVHLPPTQSPRKMEVKYGRVVVECLWTIVFWILLLTIFHPLWVAPLWEKLARMKELVSTMIGPKDSTRSGQLFFVLGVLGGTMVIAPIAYHIKKWIEQK